MISRAYVGGCALAAGIVAFACSVPAPAPMAPIAYAPLVYNWSGIYIGGNLDGGFANSMWSDPFSGSNNTFNKNGFIGGGQIGANYQFNWIVVGIEADFDRTGLKGNGTDSVGDAINTKTQWTSTIDGRIGAAFDRLLVYGKGGVAFADDKSTMTDVFGSSASASTTCTGWTSGAGLEYAFADNWTAKVEYDYLGFGSQALNLATSTTPVYTTNASLNVQEVKAGVNFKFNPW